MKNMKCRATLSYVYRLGDQVVHHVTRSNFVEAEYREVLLKAKKFASTSYFKPGDVITYTLVVTNVGSYEASSVCISDELPHQTLLTDSVNVRSLNDVNFTCEEQNEGLAIKLDHIVPHDTVYVTYQTLVHESLDITTDLTNHATISVDEDLEVTTNDINIEQRYAKLVCEKEITPILYPNKSFEYFIQLENVGNTPAVDLEISDQLLDNYILEALYVEGEEKSDYTIENSILKFRLQEIAPFSKTTVKVVGFIKRGELA